jgi:hypothetical protein
MERDVQETTAGALQLKMRRWWLCRERERRGLNVRTGFNGEEKASVAVQPKRNRNGSMKKQN